MQTGVYRAYFDCSNQAGEITSGFNSRVNRERGNVLGGGGVQNMSRNVTCLSQLCDVRHHIDGELMHYYCVCVTNLFL